MEQELAGMGIPFERQELGSEVVTDGWNILARIPGRSGKNPFLFVFHLDTAAPSNQVEVCVEGGCIRSKGSSVLGADGKLAIAVVMEAVERLMQEGEINRPIELLFTVCQELGLHGAKYADYSRIESEEAIVIDRTCQVCHRESEETLRNNVYERQNKANEMRNRLETELAKAHVEAKSSLIL